MAQQGHFLADIRLVHGYAHVLPPASLERIRHLDGKASLACPVPPHGCNPTGARASGAPQGPMLLEEPKEKETDSEQDYGNLCVHLLHNHFPLREPSTLRRSLSIFFHRCITRIINITS